jgi:hypothetical protein
LPVDKTPVEEVKYMKKLLFVICLLMVSACEQNQKSVAANEPVTTELKQPVGRVLQYGIYTLLRGGKIIDNPKTSTGKSLTKPVITRDRTTDRIPLVKDKYMAYQYRISNLPGRMVKLRRVLQHPEIHLPDGKVSTGSDFTINKKLERGEVFAYDAYAFNEDYEMVEGEWIFQIWYKGNKLIEHRFTTYNPGAEEMARLTAPSWLDKKTTEETKTSHDAPSN